MEYRDRKLFVFLKTFSKEEFIEFEKLLQSIYFKKGRENYPLFSVLKEFYPDFNSSDFTEEKIFYRLYPDLNFSNQKHRTILRNLCTSLLKSVEEYLFISETRKNISLKNSVSKLSTGN